MSHKGTMQFTGYITRLGLEEFAGQWEQYAKSTGNGLPVMALQQAAGAKCRYKYISQQAQSEANPRFNFTGKGFGNFHDRRVKVEQAGGYMPLQVECRRHNENIDIKTIAFLPHRDAGLDFYRGLNYHHLNIYQAYYENCLYGYILEFFTPETILEALLQELRQRPAIETGVYTKCVVQEA